MTHTLTIHQNYFSLQFCKNIFWFVCINLAVGRRTISQQQKNKINIFPFLLTIWPFYTNLMCICYYIIYTDKLAKSCYSPRSLASALQKLLGVSSCVIKYVDSMLPSKTCYPQTSEVDCPALPNRDSITSVELISHLYR